MTDMKIMESKPPTYEVTEGLVEKDIDADLYIETDRSFGKWIIRIVDRLSGEENNYVELTAVQAIAVVEFINSRVRKRW